MDSRINAVLEAEGLYTKYERQSQIKNRVQLIFIAFINELDPYPKNWLSNLIFSS